MLKLREKYCFAQWVSIIFSPLFWVSAGVFRLIWSSVVVGEIDFAQAEIVLGVTLGGPIVFFLYQVYRGKYDFDLTHRRQRLGFYLLSLGFGFTGLNLLYDYSNYLFRYFLGLMIVGMFFMVITFWEKISLHVGSLMVFYLAYNLTHQWRVFWLFPILILVAWSRVKLKRHTPAQVLEGMLVPTLVLPPVFHLLGII